MSECVECGAAVSVTPRPPAKPICVACSDAHRMREEILKRRKQVQKLRVQLAEVEHDLRFRDEAIDNLRTEKEETERERDVLREAMIRIEILAQHYDGEESYGIWKVAEKALAAAPQKENTP